MLCSAGWFYMLSFPLFVGVIRLDVEVVVVLFVTTWINREASACVHLSSIMLDYHRCKKILRTALCFL